MSTTSLDAYLGIVLTLTAPVSLFLVLYYAEVSFRNLFLFL
jgi:hypothetical protein